MIPVGAVRTILRVEAGQEPSIVGVQQTARREQSQAEVTDRPLVSGPGRDEATLRVYRYARLELVRAQPAGRWLVVQVGRAGIGHRGGDSSHRPT